MSALDLYESMSAISARMVLAARANDWNDLARLERDVAAMRDRLIAGDRPAPALSAEERSRKISLIHRLLDDDAEIRRHTEPWMAHVGSYLGAGRPDRGERFHAGTARR